MPFIINDIPFYIFKHEKGAFHREIFIHEYYTMLNGNKKRFNFKARQFVHKLLIINSDDQGDGSGDQMFC